MEREKTALKDGLGVRKTIFSKICEETCEEKREGLRDTYIIIRRSHVSNLEGDEKKWLIGRAKDRKLKLEWGGGMERG